MKKILHRLLRHKQPKQSKQLSMLQLIMYAVPTPYLIVELTYGNNSKTFRGVYSLN